MYWLQDSNVLVSIGFKREIQTKKYKHRHVQVKKKKTHYTKPLENLGGFLHQTKFDKKLLHRNSSKKIQKKKNKSNCYK